VKELLSLNKYFIRYKKEMATGVIYLTVANLFLVYIPVLIRFALDNVENSIKNHNGEYSGYVEVLFNGDIGWDLAKNAILLIVAISAYGYLLFLTRQTIIVASRYIEFDMRNELYAHLQKLPMSYFAANKTGDIYVRVTEDINRVREYFGPAFMYMVNTFTRAGIIITMMLIVNPDLTIWALIPTPLLSIMAYWLSGYINKLSKEIQEQYAVLAGNVQETFSSIRLIKSYVRETNESKKFEVQANEYRKKKLKLSAVDALFYPMLNFLIGFSIIFVVWRGGILIQAGTASYGNIAEFIIYVIYLTWPVASLGYTLNLIQRSAASNKRIQDFLNEPLIIEDSDSVLSSLDQTEGIKGKIEFKNVSFSYPLSDVKVLDEINFSIESGQKIGIVGKTGSGKSSLIQLIPRLFEPDSGQILIDNIPIQEISINKLRKSIGYVPQENFLFSDTIQENIAFGKEKADSTEVKQAAAHAQLLENILSFEKQFETMLGERGITLSGGQKQRTGIARALIKKPEILLFDDSLSAVDTKTEEAILNYIKSDLNSTTTIIISHRISSIQECDKIVVIENGKINEQGTHNELITQKGDYYAMYKRQILEKELSTL